MSVETEIALIKKDLEAGNEVFRKLDTAIDRMSEVLAAMREVAASQEQRITYIENSVDDINSHLDRRTNSLATIKTELKQEFDAQFAIMNKKLADVEKRLWLIIGGGLVLGFFIGRMNIGPLFGG